MRQATWRTSWKYLRKGLTHQEAHTLLQPLNSRADFFEEHWQTQEHAGDRQFEDYDDWFCEDYNVYDADRDDNADDNDDRDDNAHASDDEQVFCLGN
jgi:hypothetical protein